MGRSGKTSDNMGGGETGKTSRKTRHSKRMNVVGDQSISEEPEYSR